MQRWRLVLAREAVAADQQQRQQAEAWDSALAGSGLPIAGLDLPTPKPRFAMAAPLAAMTPAEAELLDVWLAERLPRWRAREALEGRLPGGYRLVDLFDVWLGEPPLPGQVVASVYRAAIGPDAASTDVIRAAATSMLTADILPRRRPKGDATVAYDLRPFLDGIEVSASPGGSTVIRLQLRHDPERGIGRPEEALAELGDRTGGPLPIAALVRERLVLRDRAPEPTQRAPATGRGRR